MKLAPLASCPLCGGGRIRPFKKGTVDPVAVNAGDFKITDSRYGSRWALSSCRDCGFVFADPAPDPEAIAGFYAALEDEEYGQEGEGRGRNFAAILRRLAAFAPPGCRLLDVGAASGIFLDLARAAGYVVRGIAPSASLAAEAERRFGLELFRGTAEQYPRGETFRIVTLLDVLEHVTDPCALMAALTPLLEPGGVLVIVTPDVGSLAARILGGRWWHYRTAHVNFFNRRSLRRLLGRYGFEIAASRRFAWHFTAYYLATRLLPGLKGSALQGALKKLHLRLQLFDSWEVYARKREE